MTDSKQLPNPVHAAVDEIVSYMGHDAKEKSVGLTIILQRLAMAEFERGASIRPDVSEVLLKCEEYFDNRADADCDQDGFIPNEEMKLLGEVRDAIAKAEGK